MRIIVKSLMALTLIVFTNNVLGKDGCNTKSICNSFIDIMRMQIDVDSNKYDIETLVDKYMNIVSECPKAEMTYFLLTKLYPDFIEGMQQKELEDYYKVNNRNEVGENNLSGLDEFVRGSRCEKWRNASYFKLLLDKRQNKSLSKENREAINILLACSYLHDIRYCKRQEATLIDSLLSDKTYSEYKNLLIGIKIKLSNYLDAVENGKIDSMLKAYLKTSTSFEYMAQSYWFDRAFYSSSPLSSKKNVVTKKWFEYAMKGEIEKMSFKDNPYKIYDAFTAVDRMLPSRQKMDSMILLLTKLNENNDPQWSKLSMREYICGEIANMYYDHEDFDDALKYIKLGKSFGSTRNWDNLISAIELMRSDKMRRDRFQGQPIK